MIKMVLMFLRERKERRRRKRVAVFMKEQALDSYFSWICDKN